MEDAAEVTEAEIVPLVCQTFEGVLSALACLESLVPDDSLDAFPRVGF